MGGSHKSYDRSERLVDRGSLANTVLFIGAVLIVFACITLFTFTETTRLKDTQSLDDFNFSRSIGTVETSCFDWYPNVLYTPDDFTKGVSYQSQTPTRGHNQYGTYRLVLSLTPGEAYGIASHSATYSQKLWVDGVLLSQVGTPGYDAASTESKTNYYTVYFTAGKNPTEILIQRAEFVHFQGGQLYPLQIGPQNLISQMAGRDILRISIMVGCLLTAALIFFGVFLFFKRRFQFLWFALTCLFVSFRTLFADYKLIMLFFPNMMWNLSHRLEYCATIGFLVCFSLFLNSMFNWRIPKVINLVGLIAIGVGFLLTLAAPSELYTAYFAYAQVIGIGYLIILAAALLRIVIQNPYYRQIEYMLVAVGVVAFFGFIVVDLVRYGFTGKFEEPSFLQIGMMVMLFANTLALVLGFMRTERELDAVKQTEHKIQETNHMLEKLDQLKSEFLSTITHEMRTPLAVMSGYAQLTRWQLEEQKVDAEIEENLINIEREADRLAKLVSQLLKISTEHTEQQKAERVVVSEVFDRVRSICIPMLEKQKNHLMLDVSSPSLSVWVNPDTLIHILLNLVSNANRHSEAGKITVRAKEIGMQQNGGKDAVPQVLFEVQDEGDGIPPDLLEHIFERGVSGDGSTGLGLPICKETIELYGGTISITCGVERGTTVSFTLAQALKEAGVEHD